jgi:hypothetical protein
MSKLTKEKIVLGKKLIKSIKLTAYDGDEIDIRPLTSMELEGVFTKLEKMNIYVRNDESMTAKLAFMREVSLIGIVDDEVRELIPELMGSSLQEIGAAILDLTYSTPGAVQDFSQVKQG